MIRIILAAMLLTATPAFASYSDDPEEMREQQLKELETVEENLQATLRKLDEQEAFTPAWASKTGVWSARSRTKEALEQVEEMQRKLR